MMIGEATIGTFSKTYYKYHTHIDTE